MSWWQKKLLRYGLRYGLSRTGLLEESALDLDNLDITIGKKNVITLTDVGLNIKQITKLAKLPQSVKVESARILLLRLTIPADFYRSSITAQIEGVEIEAVLQNESLQSPVRSTRRSRSESPVARRSSNGGQPRRRLRSPTPPSPMLKSDDDTEIHIPTTQEVARSFLLSEPLRERQELEASVAIGDVNLEESALSEKSEDDVGTGVGIGIPTFLANFLQGIVDRFELKVTDIVVEVKVIIEEKATQPEPLTLKLNIGACELESFQQSAQDTVGSEVRERKIRLCEVSLELLGRKDVLETVSANLSQDRESEKDMPSKSGVEERSSISHADVQSVEHELGRSQSSVSPSQSASNILESSAYLGAEDQHMEQLSHHDWQAPDTGPDDATYHSLLDSNLDIRPGDDNISWFSRRSHSAQGDDLWSSAMSQDDLHQSLVIDPDRTATSRSYQSRSNSPNATRTRRAVSPYDRGIQGPLSWPRLSQSLSQNDIQQSPGSWPNLDHQDHQPAPVRPSELKEDARTVTDNKKTALDELPSHMSIPDVSDPDDDDAGDELAQSRIYSHDEAESMYMSAMTNHQSMPGGWSLYEDRTAPPPSQEVGALTSAKTPIDTSGSPHLPEPETVSEDKSELSSDIITPRAQTPTNGREFGYEEGEDTGSQQLSYDHSPPTHASPSPRLVDATESASLTPNVGGDANTSPSPQTSREIRQLVTIDSVSIAIPFDASQSPSPEQLSAASRTAASKSVVYDTPGTFSAYSQLVSSRRGTFDLGPVSLDGTQHFEQKATEHPKQSQTIKVGIGDVRVGADVVALRVLSSAASRLAALLNDTQTKTQSQPAVVDKDSTATGLEIRLKAINMLFCAEMYKTLIGEDVYATKSMDILNVASERVSLKHDSDTDVVLGSLSILLASRPLLTFDKTVTASVHGREMTTDHSAIAASVRKYRAVASKQSILECHVETGAANFHLDLANFHDALSTLGGLSGVLELGSSVLLDTSATTVQSAKPPKGVRFAGETTSSVAKDEVKINIKVSSVGIVLQGQSICLDLHTSTLRAVHRAFGTALILDHISLTGSDRDSPDRTPVHIDLSSFRSDFAPVPQDKDLERLLNLLVPSKDQYDNDGDILIETLLRQRRKGAILKLTAGAVKTKIIDWDFVPHLVTLGNEFSQLSAVADYLPRDDGPGILTFLRIGDLDADIPVNHTFGQLQINVRGATMAHVGLPALMALSLASISARQAGGPEIVHSIVPLVAPEITPAFMARMLGDEAEPVVKLKLFNVCFEYSVPILLALTSSDKKTDSDEQALDSEQDFRTPGQRAEMSNSEPQVRSQRSESVTKRTKVELLIHDTAIGLNPLKISTKASFLFSDAKITTLLPAGNRTNVRLDLAKAHLLVVDQAPEPGRDPHNINHGNILTGLTSQNYISVATIRSASVHTHVIDHDLETSTTTFVDIKSELLLLETCADSTQTLFATLGALAPPSPPAQVPQFLTQPMTIEDMMASFSGEPVTEPETAGEKMFDVEEEMLDASLDLHGLSDQGEADDLLLESEMTSSLYGPLDIDLADGSDNDETNTSVTDAGDVAESLLEDDPFEMTITPEDAPLSDSALLKELRKQLEIQHLVGSKVAKAVDLGIFEDTNAGLDIPFNYDVEALAGKPSLADPHNIAPVRVRLHDFHIIWNLYDGYDWQTTKDSISSTVNQVEARAEENRARQRQLHTDREEEESVIGDFLFNSIYIGIPTGADAQDLRRHINREIDELQSETESLPVSGISRPTTHSNPVNPYRLRQKRRLKLSRSKNHKIAFELKGLAADFTVLPPGDSEVINVVDVRVKDVEVFDQVPTSTWRKFLTHLDNDPRSREMAKPMVHIQLSTVKTLESHAASELLIKLSILPIRLHVDQDALDFITRFFEFKDPRLAVDSGPSDQPFIQRIEVDTVDMCLDYKPKHVDYAGLRSGHTTEFMNFVTLEGSNIRLKHAIIYGLKGFDKLHSTLNGVWMPDIQRNQLPTILAGLASVRSLVNITSGVRDVVAIPVREYHKDGRIVRSIQKGAYHFGQTTASELARLGAKVALGTHNVLSNAEALLTPGSASAASPSHFNRGSPADPDDPDLDDQTPERKVASAYANQPLGLFSGLRSARRHLEHDLLTARDALIAVQGELLDSQGATDAAAALARHAPTVILRPVIGATKAVGTTLLGVGNQIDRSNLRKIEDKYKKR